MPDGMDTLKITAARDEGRGSARLVDAGPVVAGEFGTWKLVFTAGVRGLSTGGGLRISTDSDSDWGWPQFAEPGEAEYTTAVGPLDSSFSLTSGDHLTLAVTVVGRPIKAGEEIVITYGDRIGGGPGSRAQTFLEQRRYFWIEVDCEGDGNFVSIPGAPELRVAGGDATRLVVTAPSDAIAGEPFRILIKAEDTWGNPAERYRGRVRVEGAGVRFPAREVVLEEGQGGVAALDGCEVTEPGILRIVVSDPERGLRASSNAIVAHESAPALRLYWGDPHGGQVVDPRKISDFFDYARGVAGIHFAGFQRNDNAMSSPAYRVQQEVERRHYAPGRFVPLPGFEWSGDHNAGGHHNVYFRRFDQPIRRSGHRNVSDTSDASTDLPHVRDLHRAYRLQDVVITPHVGGVHADLSFHEPELEPAIEVTSTHGTFEWFLRESLERRYKVGFVGGSDCYTGRPGDDHPGHQLRRYAKAGLTGVYAEALTLEGVLEAIKARRCYATTGARIAVLVDCDGHPMGSEFRTSTSPEFRVRIGATAPVESVELYRGVDLLHRFDLGLRLSRHRLRLTWQGASRRSSYSGVVWDGRVRISGASIQTADLLRFDSPRSHIVAQSDNEIAWTSWACGYRSGLTLDLDSAEAAVEVDIKSSLISGARYGGHGEAPPQRMSFAPAERTHLSTSTADLADSPREVALGILDRKIVLDMAPEPGPTELELEFRDRAPAPGVNPYWVKVVQSDLEMAWTSPVFVDFVADPLSAGSG